MGRSSPLSTANAILFDANVLFAIGGPQNAKYRSFRREVRRAGVVLKLPQRVVAELGGTGSDRIQTALDEGWVEIVDAPSLRDADAINASDIARRTIANADDKPEHEVEKADTILAGLAIQYLADRATGGVTVLTGDTGAQRGIEAAIRTHGYEDSITIYNLYDILGDDPDDSLTII